MNGVGVARGLAWGQGLYWSATGVWPLLHMPSFEAVTGPKRERWLVRTVGVLVLAIGGTLTLAAARVVAWATWGRPCAAAEGER